MADTLETIRRRRSLRMPFALARKPDSEDVAAILEAASWAPTAHNMQNFEVVVVSDPAVLEAVRAIRRPPSETFIRENFGQLSFTEEELRQRRTGIMGTMFPPAWRDPDFRLDRFSADEIDAMSRPMPPTPLLLVFLYDPSRRAPASEGDFLGIVSLGCVMENVWLEAESRGLGLHIVSSLAEDPELRELLAIPDDRVVAFTARLGYPAGEPAPYVRVRREIEDFAHRDRYGRPWRASGE